VPLNPNPNLVAVEDCFGTRNDPLKDHDKVGGPPTAFLVDAPPKLREMPVSRMKNQPPDGAKADR
jgi:hypothetical protein